MIVSSASRTNSRDKRLDRPQRKEHNLTEHITFEIIPVHALLLAWKNVSQAYNGVSVIRVPLPVAVELIADLKHREEAALSVVREHLAVEGVPDTNTPDQHPNRRPGVCTASDAETRADAMMEKTETNGVNSVLEVRYAVLDIHKARRGEPSPDGEPYPMEHRWNEPIEVIRVNRQLLIRHQQNDYATCMDWNLTPSLFPPKLRLATEPPH